MTSPPPPKLLYLNPAEIQTGRNVRVTLPDLEGLAASLRKYGMLEAITVCPTRDGKGVEVMFGHRRHAASLLAGMKKIPCFARHRSSEMERLLAQAAENFDRAEMTALDEAFLFRDLVAAGLTQSAAAVATRRSQPHISRLLRLLRYPDPVQQAVNSRTLSIHDALAIPLALLDDAEAMETLPKACSSGPALRAWIGRYAAPDGDAPVIRHAIPYWSLRLQQRFRDLAKDAARAADVDVATWVEGVILAAATRAKR